MARKPTVRKTKGPSRRKIIDQSLCQEDAAGESSEQDLLPLEQLAVSEPLQVIPVWDHLLDEIFLELGIPTPYDNPYRGGTTKGKGKMTARPVCGGSRDETVRTRPVPAEHDQPINSEPDLYSPMSPRPAPTGFPPAHPGFPPGVPPDSNMASSGLCPAPPRVPRRVPPNSNMASPGLHPAPTGFNSIPPGLSPAPTGFPPGHLGSPPNSHTAPPGLHPAPTGFNSIPPGFNLAPPRVPPNSHMASPRLHPAPTGFPPGHPSFPLNSHMAPPGPRPAPPSFHPGFHTSYRFRSRQGPPGLPPRCP
ncbi:hypothetical protein ACHAPU_006409 [Fusarium lateritium]